MKNVDEFELIIIKFISPSCVENFVIIYIITDSFCFCVIQGNASIIISPVIIKTIDNCEHAR